MSTETASDRPVPRGLIVAAFAAIYLIWGSTYLGIRLAVVTLPPFLMGGARFLIAGTVLFAWLRWKGTPAPARSHWRSAAVAGALMIGVGNGGVNWAEQTVPSNVTALLIAGTPLWFALLDWLRPFGTKPAPQTLFGIGVGIAGVALLVGSGGTSRAGALDTVGVVVLMIASFGWAGGSLYARYARHPASPLMSAAQQMIAGGLILSLAGVTFGETDRLNWPQISMRSTLAFAYLTIIGSLIGFSAYAWLLKNTTPARLSTYAYVNPVVAVFLGWAIGGETLTSQMLWAAAVILLGVIIITTRRTPDSGNCHPAAEQVANAQHAERP
jgi:drug/metabolite transporter (DMT)-like permease